MREGIFVEQRPFATNGNGAEKLRELGDIHAPSREFCGGVDAGQIALRAPILR
jgi:hypothetical protein